MRSEAGSLKIPQDQLIHSEPMCDKRKLRVTDTIEANTKFEIHGLQTAVKDTVILLEEILEIDHHYQIVYGTSSFLLLIP